MKKRRICFSSVQVHSRVHQYCLESLKQMISFYLNRPILRLQMSANYCLSPCFGQYFCHFHFQSCLHNASTIIVVQRLHCILISLIFCYSHFSYFICVCAMNLRFTFLTWSFYWYFALSFISFKPLTINGFV